MYLVAQPLNVSGGARRVRFRFRIHGATASVVSSYKDDAISPAHAACLFTDAHDGTQVSRVGTQKIKRYTQQKRKRKANLVCLFAFEPRCRLPHQRVRFKLFSRRPVNHAPCPCAPSSSTTTLDKHSPADIHLQDHCTRQWYFHLSNYIFEGSGMDLPIMTFVPQSHSTAPHFGSSTQ